YNRVQITESETGIPIASNYEGGLDKWKQDIVSKDDKIRKKATGHLQTNYEQLRKQLNLPSYFYGKKGEDPYATDEMLGLYTYGIPGLKKKQLASVPPPVDLGPSPTKTTMEDVGETKYETGVEQTPWWNYDEVNYANQLGNYASIEPGNLPPYQQYNPYLARPTFVDPARAIAQQQGLVRGSQEAIMSGASPTAGRANVIAAQAAAAPQVANIMAQYDQSNVGIANQYGQQNAQTMNQAQMQNMQLKKQYADELEVRRQQYVNALREGRTDVAKSIMQGMKNAAETGWQNAQSDSYSVDPRSGNVYFKRGFDPITGAYRSNGSTPGELLKMYTSPPYSLSTKEAIDFITGTRGKTKVTPEAQYGGMFNPMELIWNS
ncbi:MAG: hypothetical protein WCK31_04990, partial [bacterium]